MLDTIADSAARLCGTDHAVIVRVEGDAYRPVAGLAIDGVRHRFESEVAVLPLARAREASAGRAIADGVVVHLPDLAAVPDGGAAGRRRPRAAGVRTVLAVPLLRQGAAIGAIDLSPAEVRPFTDRRSPSSRPSPTRR